MRQARREEVRLPSSFTLAAAALEVAAALLVAAVAVNLYRVPSAFARGAAVLAALCRRATTGGILADFLVFIVRHLRVSSE